MEHQLIIFITKVIVVITLCIIWFFAGYLRGKSDGTEECTRMLRNVFLDPEKEE